MGARGLLMLSLRPRLILTTDMDMDMAVDSWTARDLLMLNLRPRLILTTDMDTMAAISDTATVCTAGESKLYNHLSANHQLELGQKWIVISLNFPSPVLQFQCYHTKSLVMVSRKQENQS